MKTLQRLFFAALLLTATVAANAQPDEQTRAGMARMSCTSIMVGKQASADGSVITSHTCDSWYRTWMQMVPAKDYPTRHVTAIYDGRHAHPDRPGQHEDVPQGRDPTGAPHLSFPRHGLSLPERKAAGHWRDHHLRPRHTAQQAGHVHDRRVGSASRWSAAAPRAMPSG